VNGKLPNNNSSPEESNWIDAAALKPLPAIKYTAIFETSSNKICVVDITQDLEAKLEYLYSHNISVTSIHPPTRQC